MTALRFGGINKKGSKCRQNKASSIWRHFFVEAILAIGSYYSYFDFVIFSKISFWRDLLFPKIKSTMIGRWSLGEAYFLLALCGSFLVQLGYEEQNEVGKK